MPLLPSFLGGGNIESREEKMPVSDIDMLADDDSHLRDHIGHLTPEQQDALNRFKTLLLEKGLYKAATPESPASYDDSTMLRFLRARKFDLNAAYDQFKSSKEWEDQNQLSWLYNNIEVDDYEETRKMYPSWTGRRDKRGIPLYVYRIADLNSKAMKAYEANVMTPSASPHQSGSSTPVKIVPAGTTPVAPATTTPPKLLRLFALYQNMASFVFPLCNAMHRPNMETPISATTNISDVSGVGLMQFWNLKTHMQEASLLATAHYPETLDRIYIVGAPSYFPTVWGWIKKWFDPNTTAKIHVLSAHDSAKILKTFINEEDLPVVYGGKLRWEFGQDPILEEESKRLLGMPNGWVHGPIEITQDVKAGEWTVEAIGTDKGKYRKDVLNKFPIQSSLGCA